MFNGIFRNLTEPEKNDAIESIIQHATPRQDFFLMLILAVSMAAFGILLNSTVILVGSMLIAPLLYPLLSLALGVVVADEKLIGRSIYTIAKSVGFGVAAGFAIGFLFSGQDTSAVLPFVDAIGVPSSLMYTLVAAIAGFAAAFAMTKPHLNETLPGVAISVALVPPLATAGGGPVALQLGSLQRSAPALPGECRRHHLLRHDSLLAPALHRQEDGSRKGGEGRGEGHREGDGQAGRGIAVWKIKENLSHLWYYGNGRPYYQNNYAII